MRRTSGGYAAVVVAAGLLLLTGTPTRAGDVADSEAVAQSTSAGKPLALVKPKAARTTKASRSSKVKAVALKPGKRKTIETKQVNAAPARENEIPAAVANANAQWTGVAASGAAAMTGAAPLEVAASDQLTELGRSLAATPADDEPRPITTQLVLNDQPQLALPITEAAPAPQRTVGQASQARSSDTAWTESSTIGKIFIAFGGMLTLASAARMLIA